MDSSVVTTFSMDNIISDAFLSGANVIEVHYINGKTTGSLNEGLEVVPVAFDKPPRFVPREYRRHVQKFVEYAHKNMTYSYDTANDAQRNIVKSTIRDVLIGGFYVRALAEDVLPCHQFPCTTEVHNESHIERTTYTIHNRITFIVDFVCDNGKPGYFMYTLRYSHADNADRTKITQIFREALASIHA